MCNTRKTDPNKIKTRKSKKRRQFEDKREKGCRFHIELEEKSSDIKQKCPNKYHCSKQPQKRKFYKKTVDPKFIIPVH